MTAATVPLPAPFLPCLGEPTIQFKIWKKMLENYMLVIDATGAAWPEARQRAVLLHCLGTEGQRIFYTLPDTDRTYGSAVTALEKHFSPKINVVAERHKFRQRAQRPDETITQYTAALHELIALCDFGDMEDEMLGDQLVERASNYRIKERLLLEPKLTLEKALEMACQIESAIQSASLLKKEDSVPVQTLHARYSNKPTRQRDKDTSTALTKTKGADYPAKQNRISCYRCGSSTHLANASTCPASKVKCNNCSKIGHFAKVCRSANRHVVREIVVLELTVLYMNDAVSYKDKLVCTVQIGVSDTHSYNIDLIVDTGSSVSILPQDLYQQYFANCPLNEPKVRLVTYSKEDLPVLGCLSARVLYDGMTALATFYIVQSGSPLLGMDLIKALRCHIVGDTVLTSEQNLPVLETSAGTVVGCAKGFVHKIKIQDSHCTCSTKITASAVLG
ncbi:hypothetical protein HHUSO_G25 [Huso huso]|uniref:CCHC-type domain-containing protein n=1 Tax=Huso huso TaxID=61971 RepID=A0ABR1A985_HUSHU